MSGKSLLTEKSRAILSDGKHVGPGGDHLSIPSFSQRIYICNFQFATKEPLLLVSVIRVWQRLEVWCGDIRPEPGEAAELPWHSREDKIQEPTCPEYGLECAASAGRKEGPDTQRRRASDAVFDGMHGGRSRRVSVDKEIRNVRLTSSPSLDIYVISLP